MNSLAKILIIAGIVLVVAGVLVKYAGHIPWLGRLPGDILIKREKFTFYFPLASSIVISIILSIILWIFRSK